MWKYNVLDIFSDVVALTFLSIWIITSFLIIAIKCGMAILLKHILNDLIIFYLPLNHKVQQSCQHLAIISRSSIATISFQSTELLGITPLIKNFS